MMLRKSGGGGDYGLEEVDNEDDDDEENLLVNIDRMSKVIPHNDYLDYLEGNSPSNGNLVYENQNLKTLLTIKENQIAQLQQKADIAEQKLSQVLFHKKETLKDEGCTTEFNMFSQVDESTQTLHRLKKR